MLNSEPISNATVTFRSFWQYIAQELGDAWLGLNPEARNLKEFIKLSYDPKDYLRQAIMQSYKRNGCSSLDSDIRMDAVLDILGEVAFSLRGERRDDLFDIELLEEIAWHIGNRFSHLIECNQNEAGNINPKQQTASECAPVVSFPNFRIRKANTRT